MDTQFSFVIPVYNSRKQLRLCLDSVLSQTDDRLELICVDDGSEDGSGLMLDEFAARDKRMRVIHQRNSGVSVARNVGLAAAKGEWVSFVDADDWIEPDYLERFLSLKNRADVNFIGCTIHYVDGKSHKIELPCAGEVLDVDHFGNALLLLANLPQGGDAFGWTWNKIYRRELLQRQDVRFPVGISYFEDELFALAACRHAQSVQILEESLYNYRDNTQGNGLTASGRMARDKTELIDAFISMSKDGDPQWLRKISYARAYGFLLNQLRVRPSYSDAHKLLKLVREHQDVIPADGRIYRMALALQCAPGWLGALLIFATSMILRPIYRNS